MAFTDLFLWLDWFVCESFHPRRRLQDTSRQVQLRNQHFTSCTNFYLKNKKKKRDLVSFLWFCFMWQSNKKQLSDRLV